MTVHDLRAFPGPNVWAPCPVLELALTPGDASVPPAVRDAFPEVPPAVHAPEAFAAVVRALQAGVEMPVAFSAVRPGGGGFLVAVEFVAEAVGRAAVALAGRLFRAAPDGRPLHLGDELAALRAVAVDQFPHGPRAGKGYAGTWEIVRAARGRGIPAERLSPDYWGCLRLGQGSRQHLCKGSEPDTVSGLAKMASTDKHLAKQLLAAAGVPVPEGRVVGTADEAVAAAAELGPAVAVKPLDTDLAVGVSLDLRTPDAVGAAFVRAREHSEAVLVERFAPGLEHRVLVVGDRVAAVGRIDPPHVVGDGAATVADLVERANAEPRRAPDGWLYPLVLDDVAAGVLAAQGFDAGSVPPAGARVLVRRNPPYFSQGGTLVDLTDRIHPTTAAHAVAAARALRIPVAGLDVVAVDIGVPLEEQGGVVVEINASPGLWLHLSPWNPTPRPVGRDIVDLLYPPGTDGRIPVVALVGDAATRAGDSLVAALAASGRTAGRVGATGASLGGRRWAVPGGSPRDRAAVLFRNPTVDVAVLDTSPRELLDAGFGNDRCTAAVVLDPPADVDRDAVFRVLGHALGAAGVLIAAAGAVPPEWRAARVVRADSSADAVARTVEAVIGAPGSDRTDDRLYEDR